MAECLRPEQDLSRGTASVPRLSQRPSSRRRWGSSEELARRTEASVADLMATTKVASKDLARDITNLRRIAIHARAAAVAGAVLGIAAAAMLAAQLIVSCV